MRKSLVLTIASAPLLLGTGVALSTPAAATDISQAVELCDKNPSCTKHPRGPGGLDLKVKTSEGDKTVRCPITGPCVVLRTTPSGDTKGRGQGTRGNVDSILAKPTRSPKAGAAPANILETSPGLSPHGPSGTGAPAAPKGPAFR